MRGLSLVMLAVWVALAFVAAPSSRATTAQDNRPLTIGVITDLTGSLYPYGFELDNGFALGLEYATAGTTRAAGRPIDVIVRDYGGDAARASAQARQLIEVEGAEILVGAPSSAATTNLIDIAAEYGVILMAGPAADPRITGEFFRPTTVRACRNAHQDALAVATWAVEHVGTRYVQLAPDHPFGYGWVAAYHDAFEAKGATFTGNTIYVPPDTTRFRPYLQRVVDSGADGVIITWEGASTVPLFQQAAARGLGIDPDKPVILTGFNANDVVSAFADPSQIGSVGPIAYHYALPDNPVNDWLVAHHEAEYGGVPDLFAECGFVTAQALVAGIEKTGGSTRPDDLVPALEGLRWDGPKGAYFMRPEDHQAVMPMYVVRLVDLDDPDQKYYELVAEESAADSAPPCEAGAERSSAALDCAPLAERSP